MLWITTEISLCLQQSIRKYFFYQSTLLLNVSSKYLWGEEKHKPPTLTADNAFSLILLLVLISSFYAVSRQTPSRPPNTTFSPSYLLTCLSSSRGSLMPTSCFYWCSRWGETTTCNWDRRGGSLPPKLSLFPNQDTFDLLLKSNFNSLYKKFSVNPIVLEKILTCYLSKCLPF